MILKRFFILEGRLLPLELVLENLDIAGIGVDHMGDAENHENKGDQIPLPCRVVDNNYPGWEHLIE